MEWSLTDLPNKNVTDVLYHGCTMTCWERVSSVSTASKFHLLAPLETWSPRDNTCFLYSCMIRRGGSEVSFHADRVCGSNPRCDECPAHCAEAAGIAARSVLLELQPTRQARIPISSQISNPALPLHDSSNKPSVTSPCLCIRVADEMLMMFFFFGPSLIY